MQYTMACCDFPQWLLFADSVDFDPKGPFGAVPYAHYRYALIILLIISPDDSRITCRYKYAILVDIFRKAYISHLST